MSENISSKVTEEEQKIFKEEEREFQEKLSEETQGIDGLMMTSDRNIIEIIDFREYRKYRAIVLQDTSLIADLNVNWDIGSRYPWSFQLQPDGLFAVHQRFKTTVRIELSSDLGTWLMARASIQAYNRCKKKYILKENQKLQQSMTNLIKNCHAIVEYFKTAPHLLVVPTSDRSFST